MALLASYFYIAALLTKSWVNSEKWKLYNYLWNVSVSKGSCKTKVRQLLNQVSIEDRLWFVNMHILIFDLAGVQSNKKILAISQHQ